MRLLLHNGAEAKSENTGKKQFYIGLSRGGKEV